MVARVVARAAAARMVVATEKLEKLDLSILPSE
jgi:hypothetical protein